MGENRTKTENTIVAFALARQKIWPRLELGGARGHLRIVYVAMRRGEWGDEAIRRLECKAKAFNSFRKHSQNRKTETNNQSCRTNVCVCVCVCLGVCVSI